MKENYDSIHVQFSRYGNNKMEFISEYEVQMFLVSGSFYKICFSKDTMYHRVDGPAVIVNDGKKYVESYYLNGSLCCIAYGSHPCVKINKGCSN